MTEFSIRELQDRRARCRDLIGMLAQGVSGARGPQRDQLLRKLQAARNEFSRLNRQLLDARSKR